MPKDSVGSIEGLTKLKITCIRNVEWTFSNTVGFRIHRENEIYQEKEYILGVDIERADGKTSVLLRGSKAVKTEGDLSFMIMEDFLIKEGLDKSLVAEVLGAIVAAVHTLDKTEELNKKVRAAHGDASQLEISVYNLRNNLPDEPF